MLNNPHVRRFIALVEEWNATEWAEYLCWEVVEGKRDKPFLFLPPLPESDMAMLRAMRDELRAWPRWYKGKWELFPIEEWRAHAQAFTANMMRDGYRI